LSSKDNNLSSQKVDNHIDASGYKVHVVVSEWNPEITSALLDGATQTLISSGLDKDNIHVMHVPGTFELPVGAKSILSAKSPDAVICLGCVIKGETEHDIFINQSVAVTLNQLALASGKPVVFGVLTVNNEEQALDRAGGKYGNKGDEAAVTAIKMIHRIKELNKQGGKIGF